MSNDISENLKKLIAALKQLDNEEQQIRLLKELFDQQFDKAWRDGFCFGVSKATTSIKHAADLFCSMNKQHPQPIDND